MFTQKLGRHEIPKEELKADKKGCRKIGPCGIGKKALYLNSFYIERMYYVAFDDVDRVFKRVAMSRGGFSGKGIFGSMSYLVVKMKDGREKQCNFKFEQQVDQFLEELSAKHPEIPIHSAEAEKRLKKAEEEERAKYLKELSPEAEETIERLKKDRDILAERPELYEDLAYAAKQKRIIDNINPTYQIAAGVILAIAIVVAVLGLYAMTQHMGGATYFVLFSLAAISVIMASRVLPTGRRNKKAAGEDWDKACAEMREYLGGRQFPLPAQYAHPVVIDRMIRLIRQGKAVTEEEAFEAMKAELKALNSSVTVSQKEHDEVTAVKPMFLVADYQ